MSRLIAIGDIHGQMKMLETLMRKIQPRADDKFIFLGDYIDRGFSSKQVIEYLLHFRNKFDCVFIKGNHEDMLLDFLGLDDEAMFRDSYLPNGGMATVRSYCEEKADTEALIQCIPASHIEFIKKTKLYHIEGNYIFVHGGVIAGVPIEKQKRENLLWLRYQFISYPTDLDKIVVFGHTPQNSVFISKDKIGVDTGAGYKKSLSAIDLSNKTVFSVKWER
ncbi:MAG: metallophosphoesterase family protein [Candidatus Cloacimonadota bacterium]|nr:metallophosphoesterase family protein [Candidatus Cloacimonadota bacterium]